MIDNRTLLFLGKHELIKYHLKQHLKSYHFIEASEIENESSITIIYPFLQKNIDIENNNLEDLIEWIKKKRIKPAMFFLINMNSRTETSTTRQKIEELKKSCHIFIEINLDTGDDNRSIYLKDIVKIGEVIEQHLKHLSNKNEMEKSKIGVVGLGYVGLPVALGFADKYDVIGFDIDKSKINLLANNVDPTKQFSSSTLQETGIEFVTDPQKLKECDYIFVAVPTPITTSKKPDLAFLEHASSIIGENLSPNTVVVFESTVYPGTTEQICIPILEEKSSFISGKDFFVGYSPERINPGDAEHTFKNIPKIISGQNKEALEKIYTVYRHVLEAEVYKAPSIKVAEAAKIVENTQRDINIALMNELAIIFDALNINTDEVIKAAQTKWNFIPYSPGLVGGHCIGVDPYYLIYKSTVAGYSPKFISSARDINDKMPNHIVQTLLQLVMKHKLDLKNLRVTVLGITFKEDISDIRNSKALEIVKMLQDLHVNVQVHDPYISNDELIGTEIHLKNREQLEKADVLIVAVPHKMFKKQSIAEWQSLWKKEKAIVMDLKNVIPKNTFHRNTIVWSL